MSITERLLKIAHSVIRQKVGNLETFVHSRRIKSEKKLDPDESGFYNEYSQKENWKNSHSESGGNKADKGIEHDLALFNLKPGSQWEDVKKAYKKECKKYHSDFFHHSKEKLNTANEIMTIYNSAYDRLKRYYGKK